MEESVIHADGPSPEQVEEAVEFFCRRKKQIFYLVDIKYSVLATDLKLSKYNKFLIGSFNRAKYLNKLHDWKSTQQNNKLFLLVHFNTILKKEILSQWEKHLFEFSFIIVTIQIFFTSFVMLSVSNIWISSIFCQLFFVIFRLFKVKQLFLFTILFYNKIFACYFSAGFVKV